ncbi:hypothetical protein ACSQ67_000653 [Phaseolus vulgaris]
MMAQQQDANGGTATVLVLESEEAMGGELEAEIWGVLSLFSDDVLIWVNASIMEVMEEQFSVGLHSHSAKTPQKHNYSHPLTASPTKIIKHNATKSVVPHCCSTLIATALAVIDNPTLTK